MEFFNSTRNTAIAYRNKLRVARHLKSVIESHSARKQQRTLHRWLQERKRAAERIRTLSNGQLELIESSFRGARRRHLITDIRCCHVFCASLHELSHEDVNCACPYCHPVHHLHRYGSVQAVQEFVMERTDHKIFFAASNLLRRRGSDYTFRCLIHRIQFEASFASLIDKTAAGKEFCPLCSSDRS